jgi:hypothetical protein
MAFFLLPLLRNAQKRTETPQTKIVKKNYLVQIFFSSAPLAFACWLLVVGFWYSHSGFLVPRIRIRWGGLGWGRWGGGEGGGHGGHSSLPAPLRTAWAWALGTPWSLPILTPSLLTVNCIPLRFLFSISPAQYNTVLLN